MQGSQPEWAESPALAPYEDDYVESRVSYVHEQPRAKKAGVLLMLVMVSLVASGFAVASQHGHAPLAARRPLDPSPAAGLSHTAPVAARPSSN